MRTICGTILAAVAVAAVTVNAETIGGRKLVDYVDPFIGTDGSGHTYPGPVRPGGLVAPGPDSFDGKNFDWEKQGAGGGYKFKHPAVYGFAPLHANGRGCPIFGSCCLLPMGGEWVRTNYTSVIDKSTEVAKIGYYSVTLPDEGVKAEVAAGNRVAYMRFTFERGGRASVLIDLQSAFSWKDHLTPRWERYGGKCLDFESRAVRRNTVVCREKQLGWSNHVEAFAVQFDRDWRILGDIGSRFPKWLQGTRYVADFGEVEPGTVVEAKIGVSLVDIDGALNNLRSEPDGFDDAVAVTRAEWEKRLGMIEIEGTDEELVKFYTAMYHLFIDPLNIVEADGRYRWNVGDIRHALDGHVEDAGKGGSYWSSFGIWDIFRAMYPLRTLLEPESVPEWVDSFRLYYERNGRLPQATDYGTEHWGMIGLHGVSMVVDAYFKGQLGRWNPEEAYRAVKDTLTKEGKGIPEQGFALLDKYGYIPFDLVPQKQNPPVEKWFDLPWQKAQQSVSRSLELSFDDDCAARMATALGHEEDAKFFRDRSLSWQRLWDKSVGFMRGKDSKGNWREPFDPIEANGDYTEGVAMVYSFHVLQDPAGYADFIGGKEMLERKLDALFSEKRRTGSRSVFLRLKNEEYELMGQYDHSNEPSHHIPFLYNYAGKPRKTQELVREICTKRYRTGPNGICGNEDTGQMSAWYILNVLGFYPVNPCASVFDIGAPQTSHAVVRLGGTGRTLEVVANGLSEKAKFVKSVTFNGRPISNWQLPYEDLMSGGRLVFEMEE